MELKTTLRVFNEADVPYGVGVVEGQTFKRLAGDEVHPSERITVGKAHFEPGTLEHLHWHPIEVFYFVMSGRAVMEDIEGNTYDIGPGSVIYAPPGMEGSHEWDIKETLELIAVRATTDTATNIQFTVNKETKESCAAFDYLVRRKAIRYKKSCY